jgi:P pilus assembly chaperone PapD
MRLIAALVACAALCPVGALAQVAPESTIVIVKAVDGEASINIRNLTDQPVLLYSLLQHLPEDDEDLLIVTPPVARVEGGGRQLVRFILSAERNLTVQRLKRVVFEGIPLRDQRTANTISITTRQNIPVLIHPEGLALDRTPWKKLAWSSRDGKLTVSNDSPYVVRLAQRITLLPADIGVELPRSYILPGDRIDLTTPPEVVLAEATSLRIYPATVYGFATESYDSPIQRSE